MTAVLKTLTARLKQRCLYFNIIIKLKGTITAVLKTLTSKNVCVKICKVAYDFQNKQTETKNKGVADEVLRVLFILFACFCSLCKVSKLALRIVWYTTFRLFCTHECSLWIILSMSFFFKCSLSSPVNLFVMHASQSRVHFYIRKMSGWNRVPNPEIQFGMIFVPVVVSYSEVYDVTREKRN